MICRRFDPDLQVEARLILMRVQAVLKTRGTR
jgi:hypothetical protein